MEEKFFAFKDGVDPAEYRREIIVHLDTSISNRINVVHRDGVSFVTVLVNNSKNPYCQFVINKPNISRQEVVKMIVKATLHKPYEVYVNEIKEKVKSILPDGKNIFRLKRASDDFSIVNFPEILPHQVFNLKSSLLKGKGSRYSLNSVVNVLEKSVFNAVNVFWKNVSVLDKIEVTPVLKLDGIPTDGFKKFTDIRLFVSLEGTYNVVAERYIGFRMLNKNYLIFNGIVAEAKDKGSVLSLTNVAGGPPACFSTKFEYEGSEIIQQSITRKDDKIKEYQNIHEMLFELAEDLKKESKILDNPMKREDADISM